MKVQCEIVVDVEGGDYEMRFRNLSNPGAPIDYLQVRDALRRALQHFDDGRMQEHKPALEPTAACET